MENLGGKYAVDVVDYLLKKYGVEEFYYRAYIRKTEDVFDKEIPAKNLTNLKELHKKFLKIDSRYEISFQSKVLVKGRYKHFPMIDFSNSVVKEYGIDRVEELLFELGESKGFILNSGRCLHYYGDNLISEKEWRDFMNKCSGYPEIGERYVSHQLRRGKASLRLITNELKPQNPVVVKIFTQ